MMDSKLSSPSSTDNQSRPSFGSLQGKPNSLVFRRYESISGQRKVFNFNRYTTVKTVAMGLLIASLTVHSALEIRKLLHKDLAKMWKYPILGLFALQLGLLIVEECLLIFLGLINIQNPSKQRYSSKINILGSVLAAVLSILIIISNHIDVSDEKTVDLISSKV